MSKKEIFIGDFQPFRKAHDGFIEEARNFQ